MYIPTSVSTTRISGYLQHVCVSAASLFFKCVLNKKGHCDLCLSCLAVSDLQVGSHRVKLSRGFEANAPAFER